MSYSILGAGPTLIVKVLIEALSPLTKDPPPIAYPAKLEEANIPPPPVKPV